MSPERAPRTHEPLPGGEFNLVYNDDERAMRDILDAVVNWCKKYEAYSGESIMQSDSPQLTAAWSWRSSAGLLADIVDHILEMSLEDVSKITSCPLSLDSAENCTESQFTTSQQPQRGNTKPLYGGGDMKPLYKYVDKKTRAEVTPGDLLIDIYGKVWEHLPGGEIRARWDLDVELNPEGLAAFSCREDTGLW